MAALETRQTLSVESFSYSWLVNLKPSLENLEELSRVSFDASDEAFFIEMDPKLPPSKRFFKVPQDVSTFDFPISQYPASEEVHANDLINNGYLMPLIAREMEPSDDTCSAFMSSTATPISSIDRKQAMPSLSKVRFASLRVCRRLSKHILRKYLDFLHLLCKKIRCHSKAAGVRAEKILSRARQQGHNKVQNWEYSSPATSPSPSSITTSSVACPVDNWRRSCDSDSSIYEAVLHCKRSIGK